MKSTHIKNSYPNLKKKRDVQFIAGATGKGVIITSREKNWDRGKCAHDLQRTWSQRSATESRTLEESRLILSGLERGREKGGFEAFNLRRCVVSRYAFSIFDGTQGEGGCGAAISPRSSKLSFIIDSPAFEIPFSLFQETVLVAYTTSDPNAMTRSRIRRHWYASETYIRTYTYTRDACRLFIFLVWIIGKPTLSFFCHVLLV